MNPPGHTVGRPALAAGLALAALAAGLAPAAAAEPAATPAPASAVPGTPASAEAPPRVFLLDGAGLLETRRRLAAGDRDLARAVADLRRRADDALRAGPFSVTAKKVLPPSGDKHDYMSQAPYWWPDPSKPDGLPYVRRDGEVHPDRGALDNVPLGRMASAVRALAQAYFFTGHEPYAAHAARLARAWFLDEPTRMNPNLNYGQSVPGRVEGRGAGIIDSVSLVQVVDAAGLLAGSPSWTGADERGLRAWFEAYLAWLLESRVGREEAAAKNNHKTWYDVQVAAFALFVGREDAARCAVEDGRRLLETQVEPDGRQPLELSRTKSWDYSAMNLAGLADLATLGRRVGVDLWAHRSADGRSLRAALDYLVPYAAGEKRWPHKQITAFKADRLGGVLRRAALATGDPRYGAVGRRLGGDDDRRLLDLLWPMPARP